MMKVNIYFEIFNILNEYELLLNIYYDKKFIIDEKIKQNNDNKEKKININKNLNEFTDNDFLNYIFNSVKIKKNESFNNLNQTQNNENQESNNSQSNYSNNNEEEFNNYNEIPNNIPLNNNKSNNNEKLNNSNNNEDSNINEESSNNNELDKFIKKYYRKIVLLTHPDKTNDIIKNNIFKKAKDNFENKFLIGIIKNSYDLNIEITDLTQSLLNHIIFEIRVIQEKIIELRNIINT